MVEMGEEIIVLDEVYKIFGPQPRGRAFDLVRSGVGKNSLQAETGHVIGLEQCFVLSQEGRDLRGDGPFRIRQVHRHPHRQQTLRHHLRHGQRRRHGRATA